MRSNAVIVRRCAGTYPLHVGVLTCRRCRAGSCPLSVSVCPCLPLSLLPALVPCPLASSPAVVVAPALVSCPSAPALACCRRHCRHLSLACQCPCLPLSSHQQQQARADVDAPGRSLLSAAALTLPSTSVVQRNQALFAAAAAAAKSRAFGAKYLFTYRGIRTQGSKKQNSS